MSEQDFETVRRRVLLEQPLEWAVDAEAALGRIRARVEELEQALLRAREAPGGPQDKRLAAAVEALRDIADFGHEMDDYDLPPKQARKIARRALAEIEEGK